MRTTPHVFRLRIFVAACLLCVNAAALAETYYYHVGYRGHPNAKEYLYVYEKHIVAVPNANNATAEQEVLADYVEYLKARHPEYYAAYVAHLKQPSDHDIRSNAEVQGYYLKRELAVSAREKRIEMVRKEIAAQTGNNKRLLESDEYKFKNWR